MRKRRNKGFNKILVIIIAVCFIMFAKDDFLESFSFKDNVQNNLLEDLEIYFFDVGQADSILIRQKDYVVLIDAGNNEDGENIVNYLKNDLSINDIDIVVGTHPHEDHIGGLDDIIDAFDIEKIYMPDVISTSKTFEDVLDSIENKNYSLTIPEIGDEIELGDMIFEVLYTGTDESDLNNTSIVLKLTFGNTSYLFTGDATSETEKLLLNKDIKVDVLKVGHHGSKYSSTNEFLNKVNPTYAIIMVGQNNSYGHPTNETLNRLENNNVIIYRTDEDGTIKLTSDGDNINFETLKVSLDG